MDELTPSKSITFSRSGASADGMALAKFQPIPTPTRAVWVRLCIFGRDSDGQVHETDEQLADAAQVTAAELKTALDWLSSDGSAPDGGPRIRPLPGGGWVVRSLAGEI